MFYYFTWYWSSGECYSSMVAKTIVRASMHYYHVQYILPLCNLMQTKDLYYESKVIIVKWDLGFILKLKYIHILF